MARRIPTTDETRALTGLGGIYSVETVVGKGSANKRIADVQLVQLFLRHFYSQNPNLFKKLPQPDGDRRQAIALDGKVGPQTIGGITVFQEDLVRKGAGAVFVDGKVSIPTALRVPNTRHVFTIVQLNLFFFNTDKFNAQFNDNLEDHPTVKSSLHALAAELLAQPAG